MRKLKAQIQISLDGYMGGSEGEMDWMIWQWDDELNSLVEKITEESSAILLGRNLAEGFIDHWKGIAGNPDSPEQASGKIFSDMEKFVFSRSLQESRWENTQVINGDAADFISGLKNGDGGDIIVYGGAGFVNFLTENHLIDEYNLFINPAVLGQGLKVFPSGHRFKDAESRTFPCGITWIRLRPADSE